MADYQLSFSIIAIFVTIVTSGVEKRKNKDWVWNFHFFKKLRSRGLWYCYFHFQFSFHFHIPKEKTLNAIKPSSLTSYEASRSDLGITDEYFMEDIDDTDEENNSSSSSDEISE